MKTENVQFNFSAGMNKAEVIIREVSTVNELPVKAPIKTNIFGTIGAPYAFLSKRKDVKEQIDQNRCHILVDRNQISIILIINEDEEYHRGTVIGSLAFNPKFEEFRINNDKVWTPTQLGMFFKMNRAFFPERDVNMKLVSDLMNFTANVNNNIERSANEKGDRVDKFEQVVNSNLPKSFNLVIPIFKGMPAENIEVETFAQVNGREVSFALISPGAMSTQEEIRNRIIDEQLKLIAEICPEIAIIEQ